MSGIDQVVEKRSINGAKGGVIKKKNKQQNGESLTGRKHQQRNRNVLGAWHASTSTTSGKGAFFVAKDPCGGKDF